MSKHHSAGMLLTELIIAMAILALCLIPLGYTFFRDQQLCRHYYQRAIATQIVDGEMEALVAGAWRAWPAGTNLYPVQAEAARNLQKDKFFLIRNGNQLRLEYRPDGRLPGPRITREGAGK